MPTETSPHTNGTAHAPPPITVPKPKAFTVDDLREQYLDAVGTDFEAREAGKPLGPVVNIAKDFDAQCRGHLRPGLILLAGMPGCGKTCLALTMAARAECAAVYATFEMSVEELMDRHISRETNTFIDRFFDATISREKAADLYDRTKKAMPWIVHFDGTHPNATRDDLKITAMAAREECKRATGSRHLLIVVDSFHAMVRKFGLVTAEGKSVTEYTATNLMVSYLIGLANELKASILLIGEQSNMNQNTDALSAADSRALAYAPNQFITLSLDTKRKQSKGHVDVTATFSKNRRGIPRKKVALDFRGRTMTFSQGAFDAEGGDSVEDEDFFGDDDE